MFSFTYNFSLHFWDFIFCISVSFNSISLVSSFLDSDFTGLLSVLRIPVVPQIQPNLTPCCSSQIYFSSCVFCFVSPSFTDGLAIRLGTKLVIFDFIFCSIVHSDCHESLLILPLECFSYFFSSVSPVCQSL